MVSIEKKTTAPNEQSSTPEINVDISQKSQKIAEEINDSKKNQEMLTIEQGAKKESKEIQDITIESKTIEQEAKSETKILEHEEDTERKIIQEKVKTEAKALEQEVKTKESIAKNMSKKEMERIKDSATFKAVAEEWIKKCKALKSGIRSREGNGKSKNRLQQELSGAITNMENMVNDIKNLEKKGGIYSTLDTDKNRMGEIIYNYYTSREPARQMISLGMRVPHINSIVDSERDARNLSRHEKRSQEHEQKMAELLKDPTLLHLLGDDQNALNNYYRDVINGHIEPSTHPFYTQHMQSFQLMERVSPELYGNLAPRLTGQIAYNTYCQRDPKMYQEYCRNNNIVCRPESFATKAGKGLTEMISNIFPGIDSDPRKKQAWTKAGGILALGGAAIMGFKFFKNLFSSKKENEHKWRKAAGRGAGLLALLNIGNVNKWVEDISGIHPADKSRMLAESFRTYGFSDAQAIDIADRYIGAPVTTMSALHFIPIYELESQHILEDKNGEFAFNYDNYEKYVNKFAWDSNQKEQVLSAGKKLNKDKSIGAGLKAFGIATRAKLRSLFGSDRNKTLAQTEEVQNGWGKMVERVKHGVNKDLYNHGLKVKNPDDMDTIMSEYGSEQKSKEEINKLMLDRMKRGLLELASDDKPYTIKNMLENPDIDFDKMTMKGFKNGREEIEFSSYGELFETVYVTNRIKQIFAGRTDAKDAAPFHINAIGQIEFNNTEWYEIHKKETTVISLKKLRTDLPTIKDNRDAYNKYLNDWRLSQL